MNVDPSEQPLLDRAAAGDRDAQRELFERHREAAYQVAYRVTGRVEDALDVVQDAFVKAFGSLDAFERGAAFRTWLLRIVSNRALDLLRARKVRRAASLEGTTGADTEGATPQIADESVEQPGSGLESAELGERLRKAMERLPGEQRMVFAMYASGEMTYGEIAAALNVPVGTIMSRLFHARRKLKELLPDLAPLHQEENERA